MPFAKRLVEKAGAYAIAFVEQLPIEKFHGIGEVTAAKMHSLGIHTGADLKRRSLLELTHHFGKAGNYYYKIARAEDDRPVEANRVRKSIGAETSFAQDLNDIGQMLQARTRNYCSNS
ncbi:hypothetical protein WKK05_37235 (plasmid) [Nostoc sp. UHCC 0302]|uniref:hypothetical protein n=1 Tax=Nostoc sp. UHCC 0302 TaxID=3134896 RepID=UPI00311C99A8